MATVFVIDSAKKEISTASIAYRRGRVWNRGRTIILDRGDWWGGHGGGRKCHVEALAAGLLEF